jgi:hypothetical protein
MSHYSINIFRNRELADHVTISKMETVVNSVFRGDINEFVKVVVSSITEITCQHGVIGVNTQKIISDFDKEIRKLQQKGGKVE